MSLDIQSISILATRSRLICCKTGLKVDSKTRDIGFQRVLLQRPETSFTFLSPILP